MSPVCTRAKFIHGMSFTIVRRYSMVAPTQIIRGILAQAQSTEQTRKRAGHWNMKKHPETHMLQHTTNEKRVEAKCFYLYHLSAR